MRHISIVLFFALVGIFFYVPVCLFLKEGLSVEREVIANPVYWKLIGRTMLYAVLASVCCAVIATPLALQIAIRSRTNAGKWWILSLLPAIVNPLVIIFGWIFLLNNEGVVTKLLSVAGGGSLLYTPVAVLIGMTYLGIPLMTFFLVNSMRSININLVAAAAVMGASDRELFQRVIYPLVKPAYFSGMLLVFLISSGFYIIPVLLGGGKAPFISNIIDQMVNRLTDWSIASQLSLMLLIAILVIVVLVSIFARRRRAPHV
jgi:ABC-type spermidine/putrescine transport system permease subunit I